MKEAVDLKRAERNSEFKGAELGNIWGGRSLGAGQRKNLLGGLH